MLKDRIIHGLNSLGAEYDAGLESVFGEKAPAAQVILRKTSDPEEKVKGFLSNFYSFLEKESEPIISDENVVKFTQISYAIYDCFQKEFPQEDLTPEIPFKKIGVQSDEFEYFMGAIIGVVGSLHHGFRTGLTSDVYRLILQNDISDAIKKLAELNGIF